MRWMGRPATDTQISHGRRMWLYLYAAVILLFLVVPTLIVLPMSFSGARFLEFPPREWSLRWYEAYLDSATWMRATATSLIVAGLTMLAATGLGTLAAYGLVASRRKIGRAVFFVLLTPMIVPVILIAIGTYYAYAQLGLNNTIAGLVMVHTAIALPLVIVIVAAGLRTYDMTQEQVARSLGASRAQAFYLITLPQIRPSVLSAAVLSFLISFDEVVVASFLSGGANATLTKQMFDSLRDAIDPTIAAISTLITVFSFLIFLVMRMTLRRGDRSRRHNVGSGPS